jgi:hypothetical protein
MYNTQSDKVNNMASVSLIASEVCAAKYKRKIKMLTVITIISNLITLGAIIWSKTY